MAGDLREQIAQVLSPDVARQLAATVGLDDRQGKPFLDAAIPALLAAIANGASGQGAKALSDAVSNADPGILDNLSKALAARDLTPLNAGASALTPVIGQATRDKLANTLADQFEVPVDAITPALGAVEQATVAVLGQQDPSVWSDGDALRNFLNSQKSSIMAAVPAGLAGAIGMATAAAAAPTRAAPPPPPPPAAAPPPRPAPASAAPQRQAPPPPPQPSGGGSMVWIVILLIVILAAIAGWYWWTYMRPEAKPAGFLAPATRYALDFQPKPKG